MHRFFSIQIILFISIVSFGQQSADTSSGLEQGPIAKYYESLGEQSPLYNGREYVYYAGTIQVGHPFYNSTEFVKGKIQFDGMQFNEAMLLYDIVKDKIIMLHHSNHFRIDLPVEKVIGFLLLGHDFVHLYPDSAKVIEEGFYDRMYQGKVSLFVKRKKMIREERTGTDIIRVVGEKNSFFIYKQGTYHSVKNSRGLLNVFNDRKEEINKQLKKNKIKFRKNSEAAALLAVQYYDHISN